MLHTIPALAKALNTTERHVGNALDCYARGRGPARLASLAIVQAKWDALPEKPPVAEWLRRQLKLS